MAKITTEVALFAGKRIEVALNYSAENQTFFIQIPTELYIEGMDKNAKPLRVRGKNIMVLMSNHQHTTAMMWKEYSDLWNNTSKKERKVIMIDFSYETNRYAGSYEDGYEEGDLMKPKDRKSVFESTFKAEFKIKIATERTTGKEIKYFDITEGKNKGDEILSNRYENYLNGWTIIEWSPDAEEFCRKMYEAFSDLITAMKEKFKSEKAFRELLSGKVKLLN